MFLLGRADLVSVRSMEANHNVIQTKLSTLGSSDPDEFRQFLRRMRKVYPGQAAEAYLWYIASYGLNPASQSMAFWLSGDSSYINVLLDSECLSPEIALKAIAAVKTIDAQFLPKFVKAVSELKTSSVILRALGLLPALGDYSVFIPWLRSLSQSGDPHVRSRSSKLLCELRPNKGLVERQMQSDDPRVRSNAIEALWQSGSEDARQLFKAALSDSNHRVVGNAMVGLYLLGETEILNEMVELCAHKNHLFRAAMAWAMGYVKDRRAISTLQELTRDPSLVVRKRALNSLLILESLPSNEAPKAPAETVAEEPKVEAVVESSADEFFQFSMFS
jgi:hypothetical protein